MKKTPLAMPNIRWYGKFERIRPDLKNPQYLQTAAAGYYPPMDALRDKAGRLKFTLLESLKSGVKDRRSTPDMRLQGRNSLNLTGLKRFFIDGKLSGVAYGYPPFTADYGGGKPNPFYEYSADGFLFIVHQNPNALTAEGRLTPLCIELIVLEGAKSLAAGYCDMLADGGFDEVVEQLRKQSERGVVPYRETSNKQGDVRQS